MTEIRKTNRDGGRGGLTGVAVLLSGCLLLGAWGIVSAQGVIEGSEEIDFDRPEAWAMKYFSSVSQMTALGPPTPSELGAFDFSLELDWIPRLDEDQRRVGFNGTKVEDLNKMPVLLRPRARVGLGPSTALEMGWVPPVEIDGVKANLLSLAVDQLVFSWPRWAVGVRAFGMIGEIEGAFTCSEEDAAIPPGEAGNEFGCEAPSADSNSIEHYGAAAVAGYSFAEQRGSLNFSATAMYNQLEFQVDAVTYGVRDRSLLLTDGWTYSATAGVTWLFSDQLEAGGELYYSPLDVRRSPQGPTENDGLFNVRAILRYRL